MATRNWVTSFVHLSCSMLRCAGRPWLSEPFASSHPHKAKILPWRQLHDHFCPALASRNGIVSVPALYGQIFHSKLTCHTVFQSSRPTALPLKRTASSCLCPGVSGRWRGGEAEDFYHDHSPAHRTCLDS